MLRIQNVSDVSPQSHTMLGWSVKDVTAEVKRLEAQGIKLEIFNDLNTAASPIWPSPSGAFIAWFKNPDGNTLSLTQH